MATYAGRYPANTYKGLLNIDATNGVDATLRTVQDGEGTATTLQLSTTGINCTGTFSIGGFAIGITAAVSMTGAFTTGGAVTFAGAFSTTINVTGATNVTLPTSGTLYGTAAGSITSAQLLASLSDAVGTGAAYFVGGALGTPASGTLTNCTGFPTANLSGAGAGVLTFLTTPSSANLRSALTDETGTGLAVFNNSPTLTTPKIVTIWGTNGLAVANFVDVASAVNYVTLGSNVASTAPYITPNGSDSSIDLELYGKGSGAVVLTNPRVKATGLAFREAVINGTSESRWSAPASMAADRVVSIPDTDISCFVVNRSSTYTGAVATGTTLIPYDDSIPQSGEGDQYMSLSHTPKQAANKLVIEAQIRLTNSAAGNHNIIAALFQDSIANALTASIAFYPAVASTGGMLYLKWEMVAGTTSAITFKVRGGCDQVGTTTFNGVAGGRIFAGVMNSFITVTEYSS